jgi:hypothetical protein
MAPLVDAPVIPRARLRFAEVLGRGAFGTVRAATARLFGDVAVKEPLDTTSEEAMREFREEAAKQSRVKHANVVRILAVISEEAEPGRRGGRFGIVMPRMETTLCLAIKNERLDARLREVAAFQGAQGLAAIHAQGVLHRDIKSSNALVTFTGRGMLLCWADFGTAHAADGTLRTISGSRMGTRGYMAPELWGVERPEYRKASDVYAFGLVVAEIVSGRPPARHVEGEREERVLSDEMRAVNFDVRLWAANDLLEPVARCLLLVAEHCTRHDFGERPGMNSVVTSIFEESAAALTTTAQEALHAPPVEAAREARECKVCLDRPVTTVLRPCSHACLCALCALQVVCCPICRAVVTRFDQFGPLDAAVAHTFIPVARAAPAPAPAPAPAAQPRAPAPAAQPRAPAPAVSPSAAAVAAVLQALRDQQPHALEQACRAFANLAAGSDEIKAAPLRTSRGAATRSRRRWCRPARPRPWSRRRARRSAPNTRAPRSRPARPSRPSRPAATRSRRPALPRLGAVEVAE